MIVNIWEQIAGLFGGLWKLTSLEILGPPFFRSKRGATLKASQRMLTQFEILAIKASQRILTHLELPAIKASQRMLTHLELPGKILAGMHFSKWQVFIFPFTSFNIFIHTNNVFFFTKYSSFVNYCIHLWMLFSNILHLFFLVKSYLSS